MNPTRNPFGSLALALCTAAGLILTGCGGGADVVAFDEEQNPFTDWDLQSGKADSHYLNPDGVEVEVDIEADIEAPSWRKPMAPAILGQFAMTTLRRSGELYLESLAEDTTSKDRVEWLVDGAWIPASDTAALDAERLVHFRIRGMNAVLLHSASERAEVGATFEAVVPTRPFSIFSDAGDRCAKHDGHMTLGQSIYWYLWDPSRSGCDAEVQDMTITVSKVLPVKDEVYPEYDQLIADGKVTAVFVFGQIGDDPLTEWDTGMRQFERMSGWLRDAGFTQAAEAPVGRRFSKPVGEVVMEVDLYSPHDFKGLSDHAHLDNFKLALETHEIVVYDGHSMLGASDFWTKPAYPDSYQIFIYGGCLGYEYYVQPILKSKPNGWAQVDIVSSVIEVSVGATYFAAPALARIIWALENDYRVSWTDLLKAIRNRVGDSTFGVSGARENCFTPDGSRCDSPPVDEPTPIHYADAAAVEIPDGDLDGITRGLEVSEEGVVASVFVDLQITHGWPRDVTVWLEHDGIVALLLENAEGTGSGFEERLAVDDFEGASIQGTWTLRVADKMTPDAGTLDSWALTIEAGGAQP